MRHFQGRMCILWAATKVYSLRVVNESPFKDLLPIHRTKTKAARSKICFRVVMLSRAN